MSADDRLKGFAQEWTVYALIQDHGSLPREVRVPDSSGLSRTEALHRAEQVIKEGVWIAGRRAELSWFRPCGVRVAEDVK